MRGTHRVLEQDVGVVARRQLRELDKMTKPLVVVLISNARLDTAGK